jgi:hypothetical protein
MAAAMEEEPPVAVSIKESVERFSLLFYAPYL